MNTQKESKSEKPADNPLTPDNVFVAKISPGVYAIGANPAEPDVPDDSDLKSPRVETLLARGVLANRIKEWGNKLIVKKLNPWKSFGIVDVKIMKYEPGQLIHYGKGLGFESVSQRVFWDFIDPFLENGINWWLDYVADLCLQRVKKPKPYLQTVKNALNVCIHDVYLRMSDIDYKLRKGAAACRASENFGKNIQREDVRDKTTFMINYLNARYKEVLDTAEADLAKQPAETERDIAPGIFGWIKGWLWKLYEKTLKVVIEVILEKSGPKPS